MQQSYTPNVKILSAYAELIVKFGLQRPDGSLLPKGSLVQFKVPEVAKPLYFHLQRAILKAGHHPLGEFTPSSDDSFSIKKDFYTHASKQQREYLPLRFHKALIEEIDAVIHIVAETDIHELDDIRSAYVMERNRALAPIKKQKFKKIDKGELSWTIALYGTDHMAKVADMSPKAFWKQIIEACYLDTRNPVAEWRKISNTVTKTAMTLSDMKIDALHWQGDDMDITVGIGEDRVWRAGGGNNIPSYEVFTSPHMMRADGWIRFNQPHFRYGKRIEGIELTFKKGKIIKASATKNQELLRGMVKTEGGDRLGEVSLTDKRISRIKKATGEIMYDENMGGTFGNTHMAIGSSFHDCYAGKGSNFSDTQWSKRGFNDSVVHSDFISTTDRTVTATLGDGSQTVIYMKGQFTV